jgi:hypothetical protein
MYCTPLEAGTIADLQENMRPDLPVGTQAKTILATLIQNHHPEIYERCTAGCSKFAGAA